mmetsp:Transcript_60241/g.143585  ORF Transcript_60241/g.143585 Transcript_60241/m.143585 type:complete len:215 (+) Transcript_60241:60-704(+)
MPHRMLFHWAGGVPLLALLAVLRTSDGLEVARGPAPAASPSVPLISQQECDLLQRGILLQPQVQCVYAVYAVNWDGCTCTIQLPSSIRPTPDAFTRVAEEMPYEPLPGGGDAQDDSDGYGASTQGADSSPPQRIQTYRPPISQPMCPYEVLCPTVNSSADCVDYRSWGFAELQMAKYAPASAHLNSVSCSYIIQPRYAFKVPAKVAAFWSMAKP